MGGANQSRVSRVAEDEGAFDRESKDNRDFSGLLLSLSEILECTTTDLLGVKSWDQGVSAQYLWTPSPSVHEHNGGQPPRVVSIRCLRLASPGDAYIEKYSPGTDRAAWLEWKGVKTWRGQPMDTYRLVGPHTLRITTKTPAYDWYPNYFPSSTTVSFAPPPEAIHWTSEGNVDLTIEGQELSCRRLDLWLGDGVRQQATPQASLWVTPGFGPMNIVRLETRSGLLEWAGLVCADESDLPLAIEMVVSGRSCLDRFCASCHDDDHHTVRNIPH